MSLRTLVPGDSVFADTSSYKPWSVMAQEEAGNEDAVPLYIVNHCQGGFTTNDILDLNNPTSTNWADKILSVPPSEIVVYCFGPNDAYIDVGSTTGPRVSLTDYEANQHEIITRLLAIPTVSNFNDGKPMIFVMSPPFHYQPSTQQEGQPGSFYKRTHAYARVCERVAKARGVKFFDTFQLTAHYSHWDPMRFYTHYMNRNPATGDPEYLHLNDHMQRIVYAAPQGLRARLLREIYGG